MSVPNVLPEAQDEIAEAIDWYEARRPGLGVEFVGAVDIALRSIAEAPERFPRWQENRRYRRLVLDRFPYVVFFHVLNAGPEVVAVAHARRRPGYWLARIGP